MKKLSLSIILLIVVLMPSCKLFDDTPDNSPNIIIGDFFKNRKDSLKYDGLYLEDIKMNDTISCYVAANGFFNHLTEFTFEADTNEVKIIMPSQKNISTVPDNIDDKATIFSSSTKYNEGLWFFNKDVVRAIGFTLRFIPIKEMDDLTIALKVVSDVKFDKAESSMKIVKIKTNVDRY